MGKLKWMKIAGGMAHVFEQGVYYKEGLRSLCGIRRHWRDLDVADERSMKCLKCRDKKHYYEKKAESEQA